jgi:hypothetical protein
MSTLMASGANIHDAGGLVLVGLFIVILWIFGGDSWDQGLTRIFLDGT